MEHPSLACLAQVVTWDAKDGQAGGSGYLVAPGWVLTAAHVVRDATVVGVWLGADSTLSPDHRLTVRTDDILFAPGPSDLALLPVAAERIPSGFVPVGFGRLDRGSLQELEIRAIGFPWFKLRPLPGHKERGLVREVAAVAGTVIGAGNAKTGTFAVTVPQGPDSSTQPVDDQRIDRTQFPDEDDQAPSVWGGMSGAAVWVGGRLIGVIAQHHLAEGAHTLMAWPLEPATTGEWHTIVANLTAPPVVTPPSRRRSVTQRTLRAAQRLAPARLSDRAADLDKLAAFALGKSSWCWIQAPAFAGKSALVSWWIAHNGLADIEVVACFLRRARGDNTPEYAIDTLSRQLAALANPPRIVEQLPPSDAADLMLHELLPAAATAARESGQRLLIVVDGLDEYTARPGQLAVRDWLPDRDLPPGTSLLVTSRAGIPIGLGTAHPLAHHIWRLKTVEVAERIRVMAQEEIRQALAAPYGVAHRVLGFLAAAGAGLTLHDLADMIRLRDSTVEQPRIESVCEADLRRTITGHDADRAYAFSHDELRAEVLRRFPEDNTLRHYRDDLHQWAASYADRRWPPDTPHYLLTGYTTILADQNDTTRLVACALDPARQTRLHATTGTDAAALADIRAAQSLIQQQPEPDLATMGKLAYHRDALAGRNAAIPSALPALWARLGHPDHAENLIRTIPLPHAQGLALTELVRVLATAGDHDHAETLAHTITDPDLQERALAALVAALAAAGHHDRAETLADRAESLARTIADPYDQARAITALVAALAAAGDHDRAETLAHTIPEPYFQAGTLAELVGTLATAGHHDRAETLAHTIPDPYFQARARADLVGALAAAGHHDRAETLTDTIPDPYRRAQALTRVVGALATAGHHDHAETLADRAESLARTIADPYFQAKALTRVVGALAATDDHERAENLADHAENLARTITHPHSQAQALTELVRTLITAGDHDRAENLARTITDPYLQAQALTELVGALAIAGDYDRAENLARTITGPYSPAWALTELVAVLATAGDHDRAKALALTITDPDHQARALTELASALATAGDHDGVESLANRAESLARTISHPYRQGQALIELVRALARAGDHDRAEKLARIITVGECRAQALTELASALATAGDRDRVEKLADHAETLARTITDPARQAPALTELASALATAGNPTRAEALARTITDPYRQAQALTAVVGALATAGDPDRAETLARTISHPYRQTRALTKVIGALATAGDPDRAEALADQAETLAGTITAPYLQAQARTGIVRALATAGDHDRIEKLADQAETLAGNITDPGLQPQARAELVMALAAAGHHERAEDLARTITDPYSQAKALTSVVRALATAGDYDRAEKLADRAATLARTITEPYRQGKALTNLVRALAPGDPDHAETLARTIAHADLQAQALIHPATALAIAGDGMSARRMIAEIWTRGAWTTPLIALTVCAPATLQSLADEVLRLLAPPLP